MPQKKVLAIGLGLDMFPYPSGAGLHVGHPEGYTATDIICQVSLNGLSKKEGIAKITAWLESKNSEISLTDEIW